MSQPKPLFFLFLFFAAISVSTLKAQDSSHLDWVIALPDKLFSALDKKALGIEQKLTKQTDRYLSRLQRQETKLKRKLFKKDSWLAKQLFGDVEKRYVALKNTSGKADKYSSVYSPRLDSLSTALSFFEEKNLSASAEVQRALVQYKSLQGSLNASDQIKKQLLQCQQLLKEQFQALGVAKELKKFRKEVYYYQAQVKEYKAMLEDPLKLEKKLLELAMKLPQFKDFFAKNSRLASLFALPGSAGSAATSHAGLQTRASVSQLLIDRFGSGPSVTQALQQNVQSAEGQLSASKSKAQGLQSGHFKSAGVGDLPDFKTNHQRTKSFFKRLEMGANLQSQKARNIFPVITDMGLFLGYKLNEKSIIGIGARDQYI